MKYASVRVNLLQRDASHCTGRGRAWSVEAEEGIEIWIERTEVRIGDFVHHYCIEQCTHGTRPLGNEHIDRGQEGAAIEGVHGLPMIVSSLGDHDVRIRRPFDHPAQHRRGKAWQIAPQHQYPRPVEIAQRGRNPR